LQCHRGGNLLGEHNLTGRAGFRSAAFFRWMELWTELPGIWQ
jgi:hypothetical protein